MKTTEINIDGLVGNTHNYAGLSFGNVASEKHALQVSSPKKAALQGLQKMKLLHDLGLVQMIMPPVPRPAIKIMQSLGFASIGDVPETLLASLYSASSMWTANAATISPSLDTLDRKVHITPANLVSKFHRFMEVLHTAHYLKQLFPEGNFIHHAPLPAHALFADEGAANHMRLWREEDNHSINIFVYGGDTHKFPARQTREACEAIARLHQLPAKNVLFLRQTAKAIDAGVFHNDVIAMSNANTLIYHEDAFDDFDAGMLSGYNVIKIDAKHLPLNVAVSSYFFNSQMVTLPSGKMVVIAPIECEENTQAKACFDRLIDEGHIEKTYYLNLRESMKNGGGPACLRLRMQLNASELSHVNLNLRLTDLKYNQLVAWVEKHYRDELSFTDLKDPLLQRESEQAFSALSSLLSLKMEMA